jgi:Spy/CpxP family protein refolding chaperone
MRNTCALLFLTLAFSLPFGCLGAVAQTAGTSPRPNGSPDDTRDRSRERVEFLSRELSLSAEQKQKLQVVLERSMQEAESVNNDKSLPEDQKHDRVQQINQSRRAQIDAILTPEQRQELIQLIQQSRGRSAPRPESGKTNPQPGGGGSPADSIPHTSFSGTPLIDFAPGQKYLGQFEGFLYHGSNVPPPAHDAKGREAAAQVKPLDKNGDPNANGKIVLLSIGFSNPNLKWCGPQLQQPQYCREESFTKQALASPKTNKSSLLILNGAMGGQPTRVWGNPNGRDYGLVLDRVLTPAGVTEKQVQAIWMEIVQPAPTVSLPSKNADAYTLERYTADACRALKVRYPNLRQLFISPRSYGGYALTVANPEPFAYETGFSVKWLIEAQINQMATGHVDERAGDLNYNSGVAPWIAWGPYFWANGTTPASDGLSYVRADYTERDGTHPSPQGIRKVAAFMLNWFFSSPYTPWFRTQHAGS